jgi:hypothetical protein
VSTLAELEARNVALIVAEDRGLPDICIDPEQHGPWRSILLDAHGTERIVCQLCSRITV